MKMNIFITGFSILLIFVIFVLTNYFFQYKINPELALGQLQNSDFYAEASRRMTWNSLAIKACSTAAVVGIWYKLFNKEAFKALMENTIVD